MTRTCALARHLLLIGLARSAFAAPLPLPIPRIPESPSYPPSVVTAGGQRLLLSHTDAALQHVAHAKAGVSALVEVEYTDGRMERK